MIGGDNRRYKISNDMAVQMAQQLTTFAAANDAHLFLVPSPRCPDFVISQPHLRPHEIALLPPTPAQPLSGRFGDG